MESCPCGSGRSYDECCRPYIDGARPAPTAEALMRARYTAHVKTAVDFVYNTTHPGQRGKVDREQVIAWSKKSEWLGLEIHAVNEGGPEDPRAVVEFTARYREKGKPVLHREIAEFTRENGQWYFVDGQPPKVTPTIRNGPKIGRNDPCPCGSGKKYKKCCMDKQ